MASVNEDVRRKNSLIQCGVFLGMSVVLMLLVLDAKETRFSLAFIFYGTIYGHLLPTKVFLQKLDLLKGYKHDLWINLVLLPITGCFLSYFVSNNAGKSFTVGCFTSYLLASSLTVCVFPVERWIRKSDEQAD